MHGEIKNWKQKKQKKKTNIFDMFVVVLHSTPCWFQYQIEWQPLVRYLERCIDSQKLRALEQYECECPGQRNQTKNERNKEKCLWVFFFMANFSSLFILTPFMVDMIHCSWFLSGYFLMYLVYVNEAPFLCESLSSFWITSRSNTHIGNGLNCEDWGLP